MKSVLDKIQVEGIAVDCIIGCNAPEREKTQRVNLHITFFSDTSHAGRTDDLKYTVNYSTVAKRAIAICQEAKALTLESLTAQIARGILFDPDFQRIERIIVRAEKPEALKFAKWPAVEVDRTRQFFIDEESYYTGRKDINSVGNYTLISSSSSAGFEKDDELVYLAFGSNVGNRVSNIYAAIDRLQAPIDVNSSGFPSWELQSEPFLRITATSFLYETAPAYVLDQPAFLNGVLAARTNLTPHQLLHHIKKNIEEPIGRLITYTTSSGVASNEALLESKPTRYGPRCIDVDILFYGPSKVVSDGDLLQIPHPRLAERDFVLQPLSDLAPSLVHPTLGRTISNLLEILHHSRGTVGGECISRVLAVPFISPSHASVLGLSTHEREQVQFRTVPVHSRTLVMGILNCTPDSFSDGGKFNDFDAAMTHARKMASAGVDILDVGGQSTRPGATHISSNEEQERVVPLIQRLYKSFIEPSVCNVRELIRSRELVQQGWSDADFPRTPIISVDTFYAVVAEESVKFGAGMVNDVSGGSLDPTKSMFSTVSALKVPYIAMHMRGDPRNMQSLANYGDKAAMESANLVVAGESDSARTRRLEIDGVIMEVGNALNSLASTCIHNGFYRWNILLDPGLGFAKHDIHSLALLGPKARFFPLPSTSGEIQGSHEFPLLYGPSRKGFIGNALGGKSSSNRIFGTAAAVTASVQLGAAIVRVHDVEEMIDVVKVADAIYRIL